MSMVCGRASVSHDPVESTDEGWATQVIEIADDNTMFGVTFYHALCDEHFVEWMYTNPHSVFMTVAEFQEMDS